MTSRQKELARHALGLPNKNNTSNRNHFCIGPGGEGYSEWLKMIEQGDAIRKTGKWWGGGDMFYLTLKGALEVREPKEHLSREETADMRRRDKGSERLDNAWNDLGNELERMGKEEPGW